MTLRSKIRQERFIRIICLCGASSCGVLFLLFKSAVGLLLSAPFLVVAVWAAIQLAQPDGWYEARITRQEQFNREHPRFVRIAIATWLALVVAWLLKQWR
jgi:hypothetical protein